MESDEDYTQHNFSSRWVNIMGDSHCVLVHVSSFSFHSDVAAILPAADLGIAGCFAQCHTARKRWCQGLIPGPSPLDLGSAWPLILSLRYWCFLQSLRAPNISGFRLSLLILLKTPLKDLPIVRSLRIQHHVSNLLWMRKGLHFGCHQLSRMVCPHQQPHVFRISFWGGVCVSKFLQCLLVFFPFVVAPSHHSQHNCSVQFAEGLKTSSPNLLARSVK